MIPCNGSPAVKDLPLPSVPFLEFISPSHGIDQSFPSNDQSVDLTQFARSRHIELLGRALHSEILLLLIELNLRHDLFLGMIQCLNFFLSLLLLFHEVILTSS